MKEEIENEVAEEITEATEEMTNEVENDATETPVNYQDFEPMLIGEPNRRGQLAAEDAYGQLLEMLNELQPALEKAIFEDGKPSLFTGASELFEFVNSEFPEKWIIRKYIQENQISFPKQDIERIIELRLVKVQEAPELLNLRQRILKQLEVVKKTGFYYPVANLYNRETRKFELNDHFFQAAEVRFCRVTQSPEQNEIVIIFNELCEALNKLHRKNILRGKNGLTELSLLDSFFDVMTGEPENPFIVKDTLFYTHRLYNLRVKGVQQRNPVASDKILS
jgi:hypothetical protein